MKGSYDDFASKHHSKREEKEPCQVFDKEERDRILCAFIRNCNDKRSYFKANNNDK